MTWSSCQLQPPATAPFVWQFATRLSLGGLGFNDIRLNSAGLIKLDSLTKCAELSGSSTFTRPLDIRSSSSVCNRTVPDMPLNCGAAVSPWITTESPERKMEGTVAEGGWALGVDTAVDGAAACALDDNIASSSRSSTSECA
jgi:hypothetical protein